MAVVLLGAAAAPAATAVPHEPVGGPRLAGVTPVADVPPGVPQPPQLAATSYLLADLGTGDVLAAKGAHVQALPASTLKTLAALTVVPPLSLAQQVTAQASDLVDGSKVGLFPGSSYSVQQLLEAMMLSSGNDATTALARAAGGVPQTVARMQQRARDLGALDTVVKDPSGLDAPGQVTSAYDLALIGRAALQVPEIRAVMTTKRVRFPGAQLPGKVRTGYEIQNHNSLLFNYPGAIGAKNGYTVAARWTIIGAATRGSRSYVVTALTRTDRSWRPTAALLDWAFAYGDRARPVGRLVDPGEATPVATPAGASPTADATAPAVPQGRRGQAAGPPAPDHPGTRAPRSLRTWVGAGGLSAAALVVLMMGLSDRARRRQLRGTCSRS